jgi:hypothetical protein
VNQSFAESTAERPESKFPLSASEAEQGFARVVEGVLTGSADEARDWPPHARAKSKMQVIEDSLRTPTGLNQIVGQR